MKYKVTDKIKVFCCRDNSDWQFVATRSFRNFAAVLLQLSANCKIRFTLVAPEATSIDTASYVQIIPSLTLCSELIFLSHIVSPHF